MDLTVSSERRFCADIKLSDKYADFVFGHAQRQTGVNLFRTCFRKAKPAAG
jgi:hypothetical protein